MKKISLYMPTAMDGGVQRVVINLANGLVEKECNVDIILSKCSGNMLNQISSKVNIVDLKQKRGKGDLLPILSLLSLRKYIKNSNTDILIMCPGFSTIIGILIKLSLINKIKVGVMVDNKISLLKKGKWYHKVTFLMMKSLYSHSDIVFTAHKSAKNDVINNIKINKNKVKVAYHPLINKTIYENLNYSIKVDGKEKIILGVGRLVKEKDFVTLVKAFKIVLEKIPSKLLIIGEGPERDIIEKTIKELNIEGSVELPGYVENPYEYMSKSSVLVVSSTSEAFGNIIVEGLSVGLPIVATNCESGGPAEILNDGEFGLLTNCGDEIELAKNIIKSLNKEHEIDKLIERSKTFEVEKCVNRYMEIIYER